MDINSGMLQINNLTAEELINPVDKFKNGKIDFDAEKEKKVARDFESIFIQQLLNTMKETIPESDLEDSSSKQVKSMFYSFLAQEVSDKGGLGLWKDIYTQMPGYKAKALESAKETMQQNSKIMDTRI